MITIDEWGYPILDPRPLPPGLERHARKAVSACPTLALRLSAPRLSKTRDPRSTHFRPERTLVSPPSAQCPSIGGGKYIAFLASYPAY